MAAPMGSHSGFNQTVNLPTHASPTVLLHTALSKPLNLRCSDITKLLETANVKELQSLLPTLLESIFGFASQPGWGIHKISRSYQSDYVPVRALLGPEGALFRLLYRLMQDPYNRYEFPLSCMPFPSRAALHAGNMPVFYASRLAQMMGPTQTLPTLSLNAFEYYFCHFAYFLVSPAVKKTAQWSNTTEALYPTLLEDYLNYFLPLSGRTVPPMASATPQMHSPVTQHSPAHRPTLLASPGRRPLTPSRAGLSPLLRTHTPPQRGVAPQHMDTGEPQMWRSQTLIQILVELWLNQHSISSGNHSNYSFSQQQSDASLPSSDHVRIVRLLVKHMHYFSNSARPDVVSSPYQGHIVSALDEFKRVVIPQYVQKRLYTFLRHGFEHWPLDSQFRLEEQRVMLETWLSFVQPWRYTDVAEKNKEAEVKDRAVEQKWIQFIADNLLFYTVLFHNFASRIFRVDLASPKNALMLFRVSKVFSLPNLADLIAEVEDAVLEVYTVPSRSGTSLLSHDMGGSYLSMMPQHATVTTSPAASLQLLTAELEGPTFHYTPFFSADTSHMVDDLLKAISEAKASLQSTQQKSNDGSSGGLLSFLGLGGLSDYNASRLVSSDGFEDYTVGDVKRAEAHLEQALNNYCNIFKLSAPQGNKAVSWGSRGSPSKPETLAPDTMDTDDGTKLSPLGRYQLINGLRKFDIDYQGDPELQPIRSYESAVLVRMFYHLSSYINTTFSADIQRLYERDDFLGRVASQYFSTPRFRPRPSSRSPPLSPGQAELSRRPRLSLRWLASYQTLGYFLALYVCLYVWWGVGFIGFLLLLFLLTLVYGVLKACFSPRQKTKMN